MTKSCLALAFFCLVFALPIRAFDWETATSSGREYVSLRSFCQFYGFSYSAPSGNDRFVGRNAGHSVTLKVGSVDAYLDGVHYVLSFPIEGGDHDWLVSRMDVIKLFEPVLRPTEISGRHAIRGVVIDAGHGGSDNGAGSRFGNEKTYTLDTANRLDSILRGAGLKTVFTRRTDTFVDLYERAHIASLYSDYVFVSIHYNSATEEARGLETYCLSPRGAASTSSHYLTRGDIQKLPGNDYDTQNLLLASMVHSEIIKLNPGDATADRGVKRARFVVIKANTIPAILVEGGFVSNHMEAARVNRPDYRQSLAQAIARGVIHFVNAMGDRHMQLPGMSMDMGNSQSPPKATPVAPPAPAPTGLARDPSNGPVTSIHKSKKKKTAAASVSPTAPATATKLTPPAPSASTNSVVKAVEPKSSSSSTPGGALNLSEPATPAPSPGAEKEAPEPDEPPTVNIYPTTPTPASTTPDSSTNAAPSPTPPPAKKP